MSPVVSTSSRPRENQNTQNVSEEPGLPALSPRVENERKAFAETRDELSRIDNRERSFMKLAEENRNATGLFGMFHRTLTLSDPYQIEINNSRRILSTVEHTRGVLSRAERTSDPSERVDLLNQARRLAGLREVKAGSFAPSGRVPRSALNQVSSDSAHFELEEQSIDVSRDVAITTVVTVGTLGSGAVVGAAGRGGQVVTTTGWQALRQGATAGALETFAESSARNLDELQSGDINGKQAVFNVTRDTGVGAATGGTLGSAFHKLSKVVGRIRGGAPDVAPTGSPKTSGADDALKVNDPLLDQITDAPSIEAQRNARLRSDAADESSLVGAGVEASPRTSGARVGEDPSLIGGNPIRASATENVAAETLEQVGGGFDGIKFPARNPDTASSSSTRPPGSNPADSLARELDVDKKARDFLEKQFSAAVDSLEALAENRLDSRGQAKLLQEARELAKRGFPEVLDAMRELPNFRTIEMTELATRYIDSKHLNRDFSDSELKALQEHLFDSNGKSLHPELSDQLTKKKLDKLERTISEAAPAASLRETLKNKPTSQVIDAVEADGWVKVGHKGSHRQYTHPSKPGRVTINKHLGEPLTLNELFTVLRQAGLE